MAPKDSLWTESWRTPHAVSNLGVLLSSIGVVNDAWCVDKANFKKCYRIVQYHTVSVYKYQAKTKLFLKEFISKWPVTIFLMLLGPLLFIVMNIGKKPTFKISKETSLCMVLVALMKFSWKKLSRDFKVLIFKVLFKMEFLEFASSCWCSCD